jgi:hypothetical protein
VIKEEKKMLNFTLTITAAPELLAAMSNFTSAITSAKVVTIPEVNSNFTAVKAASEQMTAPAAYNRPVAQTAAYPYQNTTPQNINSTQQLNQNQMPQVQQAVPVSEQTQVQQYVPNQGSASAIPAYNQQNSLPVNTLQAQQQTPAQITQTQNTSVPTSAQSYTMEQLAVAATQLVDSGRRADLVNLLNSFGVQALTALPKEHYGSFATQLRALGAKI